MSKWKHSKKFLISCLKQSCQKICIFLLNDNFKKVMKLRIEWVIAVLIDYNLDKKMVFRKIEMIFGHKIDSKPWECPILVDSAWNKLTRYKKILWGCSLGYENLLFFDLATIEFRYCHNASVEYCQLSFRFRVQISKIFPKSSKSYREILICLF